MKNKYKVDVNIVLHINTTEDTDIEQVMEEFSLSFDHPDHVDVQVISNEFIVTPDE